MKSSFAKSERCTWFVFTCLERGKTARIVAPFTNRPPRSVAESLGGSGEMVRHGTITAHEGLRYAMSLPVATTISGIDTIGGSRPKSAGRGKLSAAKRGRDAGLARP